MKTIYKYQLMLATAQVQTVRMPVGAQILDVQTQGHEICVWALVETDHPLEDRGFVIFGTGHPMPSHYDLKMVAESHLATIQQGPFVWHVFEWAVL